MKCSGERSGCQRCQSTGTKCIYVESRAGKVQGPRTRKRQQSSDHGEPRGGTQGFPSAGSSLTSTTTRASGFPSDSTVSDYQELDEFDDSMTWVSEWQVDPPEKVTTDKSEAASTIQVATHNSARSVLPDPASTTVFSDCEGEYDFSQIEPSFEDFLKAISPRVTSTPPAQPVQQPAQAEPHEMSLGLRPRRQMDSQCCLDCCQIIMDLENYIMAELKASKIILGIVRRALERVSSLVAMQQGSRNLRCLMLFTTLLYQIHELLELCRATVDAEETQQRERGLAGAASGLGFGDYTIDAEEQSALRKQSLLRVIRQAAEVVGRLRVLAGVGPGENLPSLEGSESVGGKARQECYNDLELRFKDLCNRSTAET